MKNRRLGWVIFLGIQIVVIQTLQLIPEFVERFYSNGFYPIIAEFSRHLLTGISFSVGDLIYFIAGFFLLKWIVNLFRKPKNWKIIAFQVARGLSIFYFLFHILWAFNYYRVPLFDKMNIEKEYSDADLLRFTKEMIKQTNAIQVAITKNPNAKVVNPGTQQEIFEFSIDGYENLAKKHSFFDYRNRSIKKSMISLPLSYMGFSGYLNPFTNEAQVNDRIPTVNFPFTVCHEMAHQIGYASESEANFIGFLAVTQNENLYFKYAGYSSALRYCLRNWEVRNPILGKQLFKEINPGVIQNYKDSAAHWEQYETFIEDGFKFFYDHFLKVNQQEDGLESYSKFLNLLINYSKNNPIVS
ncbi:DUF3810 domain-containing protein [Flavobacterium antarcticum]|uniref:DUF3810 domain-containing protein n=1 Tax=Flavobacterium antarcticum TaxID=271155 RepID=UPI0003B3A300|nr:DUF3810 domain-containing protein [Flavobacterium antarcticum]